MERATSGTYHITSTVGETVKAFVPHPLPPCPDIDWDSGLRELFEQAYLALGRLDSVTGLLPETDLFLYMYIRKEAVLSSMIEGTQSSLSDLLMFELEQQPGVPLDDVQEVSNYVAALNHGVRRLQEGFPLSIRLLREIHEVLLSSGRGSHKQPGELRTSQNWIGGTRPGNAAFVPPPPEQLADVLSALEKFMNDMDAKTPALLKAALCHVQFETIHPFLDGNGRVGRLLITLILVEQGILQQPLLYLSVFFKIHRQEYYRLLNKVRLDGDWESWLAYFAEAVKYTAEDAVATAKRLRQQAADDEVVLRAQPRLSGTLAQLHHVLLRRPLVTMTWLQQQVGLSASTVQGGLDKLQALGIVKEITGQKRNRIYAYQKYIDILNLEGGQEAGVMR